MALYLACRCRVRVQADLNAISVNLSSIFFTWYQHSHHGDSGLFFYSATVKLLMVLIDGDDVI